MSWESYPPPSGSTTALPSTTTSLSSSPKSNPGLHHRSGHVDHAEGDDVGDFTASGSGLGLDGIESRLPTKGEKDIPDGTSIPVPPPSTSTSTPTTSTKPSTRLKSPSISRSVLDSLPLQLQFDKLTDSLSKFPQDVKKLGSQLPRVQVPRVVAPQLEVQFAPLSIPRQRRIQTAAVACFSAVFVISAVGFLILCSIPLFWPLLIPYVIFIYTDKAPAYGGRPSRWFRGGAFWRHFAGYYPVSMIKEADLPPDRPYVFGYHPHGIIGTGAFANFATDATGFPTIFPGIKPHLLTLASNFKIPIYRDLLLYLGVCSVSKRSCTNILRNGPGSTIIIVVGGAAESLAAHPGTNDLTLRKRLGFIKIAVREGADLVPVFSFGENDIYDQLANSRGTTVYKIQKKFQKLFGFTLPLFHGRGLFNYNLGLMPFRHPIVSVVGQPIHVTQNANPTVAELEVYQKLYIEELMRIWDRYKDVYARNRTRELRLVE